MNTTNKETILKCAWKEKLTKHSSHPLAFCYNFVVSQRSTSRIFLMDFLGKKSAPQKSTADQSKYSLPFYRTEDLDLLPGEISIDDFESYASKRIESMN